MREEEKSKQLRNLLYVVCCPWGPCRRVAGHKGPHDGANKSSPDTVGTGQNGDKPTRLAITELRALVDALEKLV